MRQLLIIFVLLLFCPSVFAATYYVDNAAANDSGNGSIGSPKKYIPSGIALLSASGGDTLIIADGTYSGTSNNITSLQAGTSGAWNIIKAANDGGVIVTAELSISDTTPMYNQIEGMKFASATQKLIGYSYMKYFRCSFSGGPATGNNVTMASGSHTLFEDCWFYGLGGRYKLLAYLASYNVYRRCVFRIDGGWTFDGSNPESGLAIYDSDHIAVQNCIFIDNTATYSEGYVSTMYITGHAENSHDNSDIHITGSIFLNGKGELLHNDTDGTGTNCTMTDVVGYGATSTGASVLSTSNSSLDMLLTRVTMGNANNAIVGEGGNHTITLINSILWSGGASYSGSVSATYTNAYSPDDFTGTGVTHIDPLANGLLYLPRIEDSSTLKTGGSGNGQRGAQIMTRIGVSGTLYGESGYDTVTEYPLWPWPNEDRIKTDMEAVSDRGFTAYSGMDGVHNTLTTYIWEYLGNEIPADIYGEEEPAATIPISGVTFSGVRFNM